MLLKKLLALALAAAAALTLTACLAPGTSADTAEPDAAPALPADGASVSIIWSHNAPEGSAAHQIALKFKEEVETRSDGRITVRIFANGELGSVPENDQALREGAIQIGSGTSGGAADPTLSYFDCPNLVESNEQARAMIARDGALFRLTAARYEALGLKLLSIVPGGFRETSSNRAVRSFEELAGLKIRTMENPTAVAYWKAWGCSPTPVPFSELYLALRQGLVEAEENAYNTIVSARLYERQKYIINTHHVIMWSGVYMNKAFYDGLPDDCRDLIDWVCVNVMDDYAYETCEAENAAALQQMRDAGLEVIDLSAEDFEKMREAAAPAYEMIRKDAGDEAVDVFEAACSGGDG